MGGPGVPHIDHRDRFRSMGMRGYLLLLLGCVLLPIILLSLVQSYRRYDRLVDRELQASQQMAEAIASAYRHYLEGLWDHEMVIGEEIAAQRIGRDADAIRLLLGEHQAGLPTVSSLSWTRPNGELFASTRSNPTAGETGLQEHVQRLFERGGQRAVSDVAGGPDAQAFRILVSQVVRSDGQPMGVITAEVDTGKMGADLPIVLQAGSFFELVDSKGMVVYRSGQAAWEARPSVKGSPALKALQGQAALTREFRPLPSNEAHIGAAVPVPQTGWAAFTATPVQQVIAPIASESWQELTFLALVSGGSILGLFILGGRILRRIAALRRAAEAIGAGQLDARVGHLGADELGVLASTFDQMAGRIERAEEQVQQRLQHQATAEAEVLRLNAELEERVALRTAELQTSIAQLEAFSHSISHDLRTPLRSINGLSQVLIEDFGMQLGEEGRAFLHRIQKGTNQMAQLINDLLRLHRVSQVELHITDVDLSQISNRIASGLRRLDPERRVLFLVEQGLMARGDPRLLELMMKSLLHNAWKFSAGREEATIEVGIRPEVEGRSTFFVRDNGAGFDMAHAAQLFGPFVRLHSPAAFEGAGIGLATVKRVIERHGGQVWAAAAVGEGATFSFMLGELR
jgi:signal transduction histidine kinase